MKGKDEMTDGIDYDKTGKITITFGETSATLRPPKLGEYRELRVILVEGETKVAETNAAAGNDDDDGVWVVVDFTRRAVELLSDQDLPADESEWPTWLVFGQAHNDMVKHWRQVPLGRG